VGVPLALLLAIRLHEEDAAGALRLWRRINIAFACALIALALATPVAAALPVAEIRFSEVLPRLDWSAALPAALVSTAVIGMCALVVARRPTALLPSAMAVNSSALLGALALLYALAAVRWINAADDVRPLAAAIDREVAAAGKSASRSSEPRLVLFDPGWEPAIFYLRTKYEYAAKVSDIADDAEFVLVRAKDASEREEQLAKFARRRPDLRLVATIRARAGGMLLLLRGPEPISKDARP